MNHKEVIAFIKKHCYNKINCINSNTAKLTWWEQKELMHIHDYILFYTSFLESPKWSERLWYVINSQTTNLICKNPNCDNVVKWKNQYCSKKCAVNATKKHRKDTCLKKYGVENPSQVKEVKNKKKQTCLENYGTEYHIQSSIGKSERKNTCLEKYGVENPSQDEEIKNRKKQTMLRRYSVENPMQINDVKIKVKKTCIDKFGVPAPFCKAVPSEMSDCEWMLRAYKTGGAEYISESLDVSMTTAFKYLKKLNIKDSRISSFELAIRHFLSSLGITDVLYNKRTIIDNNELDLYLPEYKLAIECNGSYWHSENQGKDKQYHLNKTKLCKDKNIRLIHIWHHEWIKNPEFIKEKLKNEFNPEYHLKEENIKIQNISKNDLILFIGDVYDSCIDIVRIGLYYRNKLIALMAFKKDNTGWVLLCYHDKGSGIVNGANKLFNYFVSNYKPLYITGHSCIMWDTDELYKSLGFGYSYSTKPEYYYTLNYRDYADKSLYKQKKSKIFNNNLSEWENMQASGYDRIWDCGKNIWNF